jgi:hypothetical protein
VGAHLFYKTRYHGALGRLNKLLNKLPEAKFSLQQLASCGSSVARG